MKVILRADIINVGKQGDVKDISDGYARNYLIPRDLVMEATASNLKVWEKEKKRFEKMRHEVVAKAREMADQIEKASITITARVGSSGKLFGSITNVNIARALKDNGFLVDKHDIVLPEPIREVGVYTLDICLQPEVTAKAKITVVAEGGGKEKEKEVEPVEAEAQPEPEQGREEK